MLQEGTMRQRSEGVICPPYCEFREKPLERKWSLHWAVNNERDSPAEEEKIPVPVWGHTTLHTGQAVDGQLAKWAASERKKWVVRGFLDPESSDE